jgi:hypothetical protein
MKVLDFLNVGEPTCKEMFLQHITRLVHIKLNPNDNYNDLFKNLRGKFKDDEINLKAVNDWVEHNEDAQEDKSVFETVLNDSSDDNLYAIFNIREVKE